ncbi:very short patch repair endonuclease [Rhodococcoides corynebacterioides]|uniref:very short patch repair endonuclease n=1 Tax=Rhodococcoides corynebacterioides TaxID=53972 RepID=UPI003F816B1A
MAERPGTDAATSARLSKQRRRDTKPELALRRLLHAAGLRYRVDCAPLPGMRRRADVVFTRARVAVYVDGCFWHSCPVHATRPRNNAQWWADKLAANVARDRDTDGRLADAGWTVVRIWEHEDPAAAAEKVITTVRADRTSD